MVPTRARIPPELADYVIDFLHDDNPSLVSCSCVCRDWLPSSYYHLYSTVHVVNDVELRCNADPNPFERLLSFLQEQPRVGGFMRELHLSSRWRYYLPGERSGLCLKVLQGLLQALPALRVLELGSLHFNPPHAPITSFAPTATAKVEKLYLHSTRSPYGYSPSIFDLLQLFHEIEELHVGDGCQTKLMWDISVSRRTKVKSLKIAAGTEPAVVTDCLRGLRAVMSAGCLQRVELHAVGLGAIPDLNAFIRQVGRNIRQCYLNLAPCCEVLQAEDLERALALPSLSTCTNLEDLHFSVLTPMDGMHVRWRGLLWRCYAGLIPEDCSALRRFTITLQPRLVAGDGTLHEQNNTPVLFGHPNITSVDGKYGRIVVQLHSDEDTPDTRATLVKEFKSAVLGRFWQGQSSRFIFV